MWSCGYTRHRGSTQEEVLWCREEQWGRTFPMEVKMDVRWSSEEGWDITEQGPMCVFLGVPAGEIVQMRSGSGRVKWAPFFGAPFLLSCLKSSMATRLGCRPVPYCWLEVVPSSTPSFLLEVSLQGSYDPLLPLSPSLSISTGFSNFEFGRERV